jgi:hypothetical protein
MPCPALAGVEALCCNGLRGPTRGGGTAACRLPEELDGDGYESRKLARELKRRHGWRLHITKRRQRDLDRGAHVCVALAEIVA